MLSEFGYVSAIKTPARINKNTVVLITYLLKINTIGLTHLFLLL